jgi:trypsin
MWQREDWLCSYLIVGVLQEDIGAPLVAKDKLVGIASWSEGCGEARYPGVYTKISALRDWIETNAGV